MSENNQKPEYWNDDKLGRYKQAQLLKDFLDQQYQSDFVSEDSTKSFVLNLDAEWGYGKTFFLDRFARDLANSHIVLRYNAWANDYAKDPLLSFIAQITRELTDLLESYPASAEGNENRAQKFRDSALRVIKSAGKAAAPRLLTAGISTLVFGIPVAIGNTDESESSDNSGQNTSLSAKDQELMTRTIGDSVEAALANVSSDIFDEENSRRAAVDTFKKSLGDIVQVLTEQELSGSESKSRKAPIYILIDELDRCRPDFTIELIECVKHIFSVNGLYFIFATDGSQLQAALNGIYGESFDAELYFNRIFNKEIGLRIPDQRTLSEALINEIGLESAVQKYDVLPYAADSVDNNVISLQEDFRIVSEFFGLDLRSQKQVLSAFHTLVLARSHRKLKTHSIPALTLLVIWHRKKEFFRRLMNSPTTFKKTQDLENSLRSIANNGIYGLKFEVAFRDPQSSIRGPNKTVTSLPQVMASFINMYAFKPLEYVEYLRTSNAQTVAAEARYVTELKNLVGDAGYNAERINPLSGYFEDITMVS